MDFKRLSLSPFLSINTKQRTRAAFARPQHAGEGGALPCPSRRRPTLHFPTNNVLRHTLRKATYSAKAITTESLLRTKARKKAFRKGTQTPQHRHSPKSPANRVRKREATLSLPHVSRECFALHDASCETANSKPSNRGTILSTRGRLETFPSPQAVASVTPPWGPGRKSLGDGYAAAAPATPPRNVLRGPDTAAGIRQRATPPRPEFPPISTR